MALLQYISEKDIQTIIKTSTPFFIYIEEKLNHNLELLKKYFSTVFSGGASYSFSLKTQPNFKVIDFFKREGVSFDVASKAELEYLLALGVAPKEIYIGGVGVTNEAIDRAFQCKIGAIHCDSLEVVEYVLKHPCRLSNASTKITLRFYNGDNLSKIGFTENEIINLAHKLKSVRLDGLHVYLGRESYSLGLLDKTLRKVIELFSQTSLFCEKPTLFLGPGIPDLEISNIIDEKEIQKNMNLVKFPFDVKIEVGRALCSSAGYYGAPILAVKNLNYNQNQKLLIIDGGLQHLGSPWGTIKGGPLQIMPYYFNSSGQLLNISKEVALVYGSLCLWHDCLHPRLPIPSVIKRSDWLMMPHMGAYGLTAGVPLFIGENLPREFYNKSNVTSEVTHQDFGSYTIA